MAINRLLRTFRIRELLSYGPHTEPLELRPLNVLIGPNASGKTNLIETLSLVHAMPSDLTSPIRDGGGITEWLWKGNMGYPIAEIETTVHNPESIIPLRHRISFTVAGQRMELVDEAVENESPSQPGEPDVYFYYRYQMGRPVVNFRSISDQESGAQAGRVKRSLRREDLSIDQSVLSQRKDPDQYPEITYLANQYSKIRFYREWNLGRYTAPRLPQKADLPEDFLLEDASNLGLVINDLQHTPDTKKILLEYLQKFYDGVVDITTKIHGGTVQVFLHEKGLNQPIPATRISDGTLRYLCLLVVLCHPNPPPLICIEEPELGLHPDILSTIAELLVNASERTQLVVTTHSDVLVSALSDSAESVIVCGRDQDGTRLRRVELQKVKAVLEEHTLGELWRMGEIGGTRW
jgi:predicted ATPase